MVNQAFQGIRAQTSEISYRGRSSTIPNDTALRDDNHQWALMFIHWE